MYYVYRHINSIEVFNIFVTHLHKTSFKVLSKNLIYGMNRAVNVYPGSRLTEEWYLNGS